MGTLDAPEKSRGVSFQLATGTVSCAKAASWKLTWLSNATFVGRVTLARLKHNSARRTAMNLIWGQTPLSCDQVWTARRTVAAI